MVAWSFESITALPVLMLNWATMLVFLKKISLRLTVSEGGVVNDSQLIIAVVDEVGRGDCISSCLSVSNSSLSVLGIRSSCKKVGIRPLMEEQMTVMLT